MQPYAVRHTDVPAYEVYRIADNSVVRAYKYKAASEGTRAFAMQRANGLRNDLNSGSYAPDKMFPFATSRHTMTD